jgi:nitroreductase/dihydropteridine reductase
MNLIEVANKRYSTKVFDPEKQIKAEDFEQIKTLLRLSPSSVNSQPWHFIIADTPETRKRMSIGTQGFYSFNEAKVTDASHVILFCVKSGIDDDYLRHILELEDGHGRFSESSSKEGVHKARSFFTDFHRYELKDVQHWMEKQVYLNMGTVLLGAGLLGIDAVPMEGVDQKALDEEFKLREKGYTAVAMVALGYHKEDDFNALLPKSRRSEEEVITIL